MGVEFGALMRLVGPTVCERVPAKELISLRAGSRSLRALVGIEARRRYDASSIAPPAVLLPQPVRDWLVEHGGSERSSLRTLSPVPPDWVMLLVVLLLDMSAPELITSALPNDFFAPLGAAEGPSALSFQLGPILLATLDEAAQLSEVARMHVVESVVDFSETAREMRTNKQYEARALDGVGPLSLPSKALVRALHFGNGASGDAARISIHPPCWAHLDALAAHEATPPATLWANPPFCAPPAEPLPAAPKPPKGRPLAPPRAEAAAADDGAAAAEARARARESEAALYALTRLARAMRRTLVCGRAAQALRNAGAACYATRDLARAAECYAHASGLRPDDSTLHSNRALCLLGLGAARCAAYEALYAVELGAPNSKGARHLAAALVACGHSSVPTPDFVKQALTELAATEPGAGAREQLLGLVAQLGGVRESTLNDALDALDHAEQVLTQGADADDMDDDADARRRRLAASLDLPFLIADVLELSGVGMALSEGYPRCARAHAAHAPCTRTRVLLERYERKLARALIGATQPPLQHRFLGAIAHTRGVEGELLALLRRCRLVAWEREMTLEIAAVDAGERGVHLLSGLDGGATPAERARAVETAEALLSLSCSLSYLLWLGAIGDATREEPPDQRTRLAEQLLERVHAARVRLGGEARWRAEDTEHPAFSALSLMRPSLRLHRRLLAAIDGVAEYPESARWPMLV